MIKKIKNNWQWIVLFLSIFIVIHLTSIVLRGEIIRIDTFFHAMLVKNLRSDFLTPIMKFFTFLGSSYMIITVTILTIFLFKNKRKGIFVSINLILVVLINQLLKFAIQRDRPFGVAIMIEKGFSFPSGHSMVSTAFYGFLIYLVYRYCQNNKLKYSFIFGLSCLIFLIGISRVYLGVHYMSDVVAGFFLSIAYLILYIRIVNRYIEEGDRYEK